MKNILVAGGTGLIGSRLIHFLMSKDYNIGILTRQDKKDSDRIRYFKWDVNNKTIDVQAIKWADGLINLAGAGIADERWTESRKKVITNSRIKTNEILLQAFLDNDKKPEVYVSSGGMNFYGDSGDQWLTEADPKGKNGFLPDSCEAWERAVNKWREHDIRTVQYRISIVLSTKGGALPKLTMTMPVGLMPYFGNGRQWYSWIHIDDICRLFVHALEQKDMNGIYNAASPNPLTNKDFVREILDAAGQFGITPPVPAFALKIGLGDMAETVLTSVRLSVKKLMSTGFKWQYPELRFAYQHLKDQQV